MAWCVDRSNELVWQFENELGIQSWKNKDDSSKKKCLEDCIRLVGIFEKLKANQIHVVSGLEETLAAIRSGEELLDVRDVDVEDVMILADELKLNSTLLGLDLWKNKIGSEGAYYLSEMLKKNSTLLSLNLYYNEIGDDGARYLSDGLRENSTLLYLVLPRNLIGVEGAAYLSNMLMENSTLLHLHAFGNDFGLEGARHFLDSLDVNSSLLSLEINHPRIKNYEFHKRIKKLISDRTVRRSRMRSFDECRSYLQEYLDQLPSSEE